MKYKIEGWKCDICGSNHDKEDVCYYDSNKIVVTSVGIGGSSDEVHENICRVCLSNITEFINSIKR